MMTSEQQTELNKLLDSAKNCPNKGRMYQYETYKRCLQRLNLSSEDYMYACRELATHLEV